MSLTDTQQIFETVKAHLLSMTYQSVVDGFCLYRTPYGNRCAVGCLIPDNLYTDKFEQNSLMILVSFYTCEEVFGREFTEGQLDLLVVLQSIHDEYDNWTAVGLDTEAIKLLAKLEERVYNNEFD